MLLYLVRHGQTAANSLHEEHGHLDDDLDDTGRAQAAALGAAFAGVAVDAVVCSPLKRAIETAAPLAATVGRPLVHDPALMDRDYGPWTGHRKDEVAARFGSIENAPGVESWRDFTARALGAMADVVQRHADAERLVVVSHDAINRAVLSAWCPEAGLGDPQAIAQSNACWNRLSGGAGDWTLDVLDAVAGDGHVP